MAGVCEGADAVVRDAQGQAGGEAVGYAASETCIEAAEDVAGIVVDGSEGANRAYDEGDGHSSLEAFAADVAEDEESGVLGLAVRRVGFEGDELEEVSADFLRR